ncbi:death domain-containing protein CRADD-like [Amphiura filiformis]|uniref:death domain-containing protein CRADD-like n=1 Tax=Amphiura filiformis TaxID=82378 RepID=UPI003B20EDA8
MEPMTDRHRAILRKSRVFLVPDIELSIIDHLVSELVLTAEDEERINAEKVRHDKIRKLIQLLPRRGDNAYDIFLKVLHEQQLFLYEKIKELENLSDDILLADSSYSQLQNGPSGDSHPREDACLIRENQRTRGIITHPTDVEMNCQPVVDIKPCVNDFNPNLTDMKTEPMDTFGLPPICLKITGSDEGQRIDPMRTIPRNPHKIVPQKALSTLASNLGQEWEALAVHMNFTKNKLYHFKENSKYNVWGQVFAFLTAWRNSNGSNATFERLIGELRSFQTTGVAPGAYRHLFFE